VPIRLLSAADAAAFQALRLQGLLECPTAFAASHADEAGTPLAVVAERLARHDDAVVFGAFDDAGALQGVAALQRETLAKLAHKAWIWGVYVAPSARRAGLGEALLRTALAHAAGTWRLRQVNLGVNTRNTTALALYRRLGFEVFGTERHFLLHEGELHDEHHMVCVLPPAAAPLPSPAPFSPSA
jgi:hypothetical protein